MTKLLTLTALALALSAAPALARCHGSPSPDGHWNLNLGSWTNAELTEVQGIADKIKAIDPASTDGVADFSAVLDQMECSGIEHAEAVDYVLGLARSHAELRTPEGRERFLKDMEDLGIPAPLKDAPAAPPALAAGPTRVPVPVPASELRPGDTIHAFVGRVPACMTRDTIEYALRMQTDKHLPGFAESYIDTVHQQAVATDHVGRQYDCLMLNTDDMAMDVSEVEAPVANAMWVCFKVFPYAAVRRAGTWTAASPCYWGHLKATAQIEIWKRPDQK